MKWFLGILWSEAQLQPACINIGRVILFSQGNHKRCQTDLSLCFSGKAGAV